jgi:serine/threonine protein phosphatase PrpC
MLEIPEVFSFDKTVNNTTFFLVSCSFFFGEQVGGHAGTWDELTEMHHVDNEKEKNRILAAGGEIKDGRIWGGPLSLQVTRALGDAGLYPFVDPHPFTTSRTLKFVDQAESSKDKPEEKQKENEEDAATTAAVAIVLGTDGLWEVVKPEEAAAEIVRGQSEANAEAIANRLRMMAEARGSDDNISVIVLYLFSKKPSS